MILTKKDLENAKAYLKDHPANTHDYVLDSIKKIASKMTNEQLLAFRDEVIRIRDMHDKPTNKKAA